MKILVFSDSHGRTMRMIECIEEEMPDMLFHLGDMVDDTVDLRSVFPEIPLVNVCGNNDWGSDAPVQETVDVQGTRFFLTHGHRHRVRTTTERLADAARDAGCQVALYGHTHESLLEEYPDLTVANPGSISMPYGELPSYLRITVEQGKKPKLELIHIEQEETHWFRRRLNRKKYHN
ncbi:MAG: metallophosphoesterase [Eubacteriales bacterium]|nr:metallophosphoesterase [Eubacteriales bacterium]